MRSIRVLLVDGPVRGQTALLTPLELDARMFELVTAQFTETGVIQSAMRYRIIGWTRKYGWQATVMPGQ